MAQSKKDLEILHARLARLAESMPLGIHKLEDLYDLASEQFPFLRGYKREAGLTVLKHILNKYGPEEGIMHPRRGGYTVGFRAADPWQEIMISGWRSASEILVDARARGFDLPEKDHAAAIVVGREVSKLPWTKKRYLHGKAMYSTTAGPYGDKD